MKKSFYLLIVSIGFTFPGHLLHDVSLRSARQGRRSSGPVRSDGGSQVAQAERSQGAKYCPEKIAKARGVSKEGCRDLLGLPHGGGYGTLSGSSPGGQGGRRMPTASQRLPLLKLVPSPPPPAPKPVPPPPPPPPPPPAPKPVPPPPLPPPPPPPAPKQPISFHSVYFDFDKSRLKPGAVAELDRAAKIMLDRPGA